LDPLAKPHCRLRLQPDEFLPVAVRQNHRDDVIAVVVHA
jgi:hypothetical protein